MHKNESLTATNLLSLSDISCKVTLASVAFCVTASCKFSNMHFKGNINSQGKGLCEAALNWDDLIADDAIDYVILAVATEDELTSMWRILICKIQ